LEDVEDSSNKREHPPTHRTKTTTAMMRARSLVELIEAWPRTSPDLPPIESVSGIIEIAAQRNKNGGELTTMMMGE
jgi:hypothetical protein